MQENQSSEQEFYYPDNLSAKTTFIGWGLVGCRHYWIWDCLFLNLYPSRTYAATAFYCRLCSRNF